MSGSSRLGDDAVAAFLAGVAAVDPTRLVKQAVREGRLDDWLGDRERPRPVHVLALGKAAPRMLWGLVEASVPFSGTGAAPPGVLAPLVDTFQWHKGEHPVPGPGSFAAGRAVLAWADALPKDAPVLVLLSGGASACCEVAAGGEADLVAAWSSWAREGLPIEELNRRRSALSMLKGGRLGGRLLKRTSKVRVWLLADTEPATAAATVGSAPCHVPDIAHHVLADASHAAAGAAAALADMGYATFRHAHRLAGTTQAAVDAFLEAFATLGDGAAALVGAGETTDTVPAAAPPGGRAQHAALLAALRLKAMGSPAAFMAAGTDGRDGATRAAGAWADAGLAGPGAEAACRGFAAARFLERAGRTFETGPTGTNANDVWIALRGPPVQHGPHPRGAG